MRRLASLVLFIVSINASANINFIDLAKIPGAEEKSEMISFLVDNLQYYDHWQPEWTYEVSKKSLIKELRKIYSSFSKEEDENIERYLLLGDIAHFLYNLDENGFHENASENYLKASTIDPADYRAYWFLATHYSLAAVQDESVQLFLKAEKMEPGNKPVDFWSEYAFAMTIANMPSHSIYAMNTIRDISGEPGYFEEELGDVVRARIVPVNRDSSYSYMELWTGSFDRMNTFTSRPLGLKMLVDSSWSVTFYDYKNYSSFVTIVPPAITNSEGRDITYTIAIMAKVVNDDGTVEEMVESLTSEYKNKSSYNIPGLYPGMVSVEIIEPEMYSDIGGAHLHMIGIRREQPENPGLLLEEPVPLPIDEGGESKLAFYSPGESKARFEGAIQYAIMLDTCEDIYDRSLEIFMEMLKNLLIIE